MMHAEPRPSVQPDHESFFELSTEMLGVLGFGGCLETVNQAWETVLGFSPDGLRGSLFLDMIHPEDEERARTALLNLAHGGPASTLKLRTRHRDGGHIWVAWRLSASREKRLYYLAGRNGATPASEESRKLSELGLVAAVVAHDFNNVLSVVRGCASMLAAQTDPGSPLMREIEDLEKATRHGAALVEQVLAHSGETPPPAGLVDPNEVIAQMDWLLRCLLSKSVSLDVLLAPGLGKIAAEDTALREVVVNLTANA